MISRKEINRLAFPAMISGIVEPVISLVDAAFVGRLGAAPLAGVGLASSFFLLLVWMLSQTKSAVTAKVADHYGKGDMTGIAGLVPIALWLNIFLGILLLLASITFSDEIFKIYAAKGAVLESAQAYYSYRCLGFPLVFGTVVIFGTFRGMQNTSWPMWTSLAGGIINLILDPILIFGIEGHIQAMGVTGAAWASVAAQLGMFIIAVSILLKRTQFKLFPSTWKHPQTKSLLALSGDLFIRTFAMNVAYYFGNRQATILGDAQIAAHTIAINIWLFSAYFIDGYAEAAMVLSGRLKGEKNWKELRHLVMQIVRLSIQVGGLIALAYGLVYSWVGLAFTNDPDVLLAFASIFWIVILSQPINGIAFAMDGVFNGLGDGALMRNVLVGSTLLVFLPLVLLSTNIAWGLQGVWLAFLLWMIARGLPLLMAFRKRYPQ